MAGAKAPAGPLLPSWQGTLMANQPQLSAQDLLAQRRGPFEKLCSAVAAAGNAAPAGQVSNASQEEVRDLLADSRLATSQAAVRLRLDAAQAAFPPPRGTRARASPCGTRALKGTPPSPAPAA